jgi:transglutaminase-like putative cysteine protease/tetratricopeptide (TPR) repeat protein
VTLILAAQRFPGYLLIYISNRLRRAILSCPYRRSALSFAVKALLLCTALVSAFAAGGNEPEENHFSPDAAALYQRESQVPPASGADVLFLDDEETVVFDTEGRAVRSRYFLYKVLTQKGAEGWGDISSSWEPWHEEHPILRARVITPDSAVHVLDEKTITDAPAKENADHVFSDRRVLRAPLPAIAPGSLVEEELVSTESAPFFGAGSVERFYFGSSVPVQHTRLILDAPAALPLRYNIQLLPDLKPQRNENEGRVRLTFDYGLMETPDDAETKLPSDLPAYPSITFSSGDSWRQVAEEYGKIVDKQITGADLKSLVGKLIAGKVSRDEKAAAILAYLDREVRYTGVEFGESAMVPHSPNETLGRKYGDCKDKASLLAAMLRVANIPAYIALLNAGSREDVAPDLPGMGMFDHAIVYVPGPPDLWIDATDEYARLGEIPNVDQGRRALIARPGSTDLLHTPVSSSADNVLIEKREVYLAENGPARIIETSQPHGSSESSYRRDYADKQNKAAKDGLTNYVKSQYLAEKLDRIDRSDPTDFSKQFELVLESDHAKRGVTDLNVAAVAIRFEGLFSLLPADLRQREKQEDKADKDSGQKPKKKRTADYQLPEAFVTEWHYSIAPPAGFRPKPLPSNAQLSLGPCTLTEEFAGDKDGVVHATLRFDTVKRRLTASEATELRNKVVQLIAGEPILIYFEPVGQTLVSQGKVREALQSYRELIALHPKEAVHHLQIAAVLLTAGLGEAARAEALTAVKLEPTSALAEKTLADILEYDMVGRRLRPGSDYAGAEVAFRAAEKLDPDDKTTVANLAVLLEYNHWGLRYGPGARLKEALVEYRKLTPEKIAEFGMQNNIPFALFYDGQFVEARKAAEVLNPQPIALIVACEAALNGSSAALAEARKRTGQEEQFKQIAAAAGQMLVNLRKYPQGADLEEAGASGNTASDTAAYAALYRKTVPREQLKFSDDPSGAALRFIVLTDDPGLTPDQLRSVSSRNGARALVTSDVLDGLVKEAKGTLSQKARNGDFADVGLDLQLTRAQPKIEGNDSTGYKVILWPSYGKSARYIVKEDGHYKLLGTSRDEEGVGIEVLERLSANDLAGARVLLDWLREDWHLAGGDDPLSSAAFPRTWTKGKEADATTMKVAAASILTWYKQTAPQGLAILEPAKDSARNDAEKVNILLAVLNGYSNLDEYDKALAVAADLARQYPESERAFLAQTFNLRALGRSEEADGLAAERLKRIPGDPVAMRVLVYNATTRGDYGKAHALAQNIIDEGKGEAQDLNRIAWDSLFTGKVELSDIEDALKGAQLGNNNSSILHTLGCVYADVGKTKEAREVLIQAMDVLNLDEPDENYWYAFGRIAEQYGERDAALANYARVTKPKRAVEIPDSTYYLSHVRMQTLRGEK